MLSNDDEKEFNLFKNSFFKKIYIIPSICWFLILLILMIPDETESDPLTWKDFIIIELFLLIFWFGVSFVITLIVNEIKKVKYKSIVKKLQSMIISDEIKKVEVDTIQTKKKSHNFLYKCESIIDEYEYVKMAKYFPKKMYLLFIKRDLVINLIFLVLIFLLLSSLGDAIIFFIFCQFILLILYKLKFDSYSKKVFNEEKMQGSIDEHLEFEFYDDSFIKKGDFIKSIIKYSDISRCVEDNTNFYLEYLKQNEVIIIQKKGCELELINFIREKFNNVENRIEDNNIKISKNYKNPNAIKNGMIILFIVTIASLWGAAFSVILVNRLIPQYGFSFVKNMWVFWCWLPIPILSIALGFKYKKDGFNCVKNIVAGFIIGFLLLIYGSFCLLPTFSVDYSKIDQYKDIIDAELPKSGNLEIRNIEGYDDKTEYTIIDVYYGKENLDKLENSIENSENWILSKKIKSELKIFIPSSFYSNDDVYYSIYNMTTREYNTLPDSSGDYEIYAMKYNKLDKHLEIHKFVMPYIK